jgi:hypothetical protein
MNSPRLCLTFRVDPDSPLDTLEMVLATARRISLRLARMQVRGELVFLDLRADEEGPLTLFCARLHNLIGVHSIALNICMLPIEQKYRTLRPSHAMPLQGNPCR